MTIYRIQRGSDDQPDNRVQELSQIIARLERANPNMYNDAFYNRVNGRFSFRNLNNNRGDLEYVMHNVQDEIAMANMLLNRANAAGLDTNRIGSIADLAGYSGNVPFMASFIDEFLDNVQFLDRQPINNIIRNPITNRQINVNNRTYRRIFGNIRLQKTVYAPLSRYETEDYTVTTNCVYDYLKTVRKIPLTQENLTTILNRQVDITKGFTYHDIFKIAKTYNFAVSVYDIRRDLIDSFTPITDKRKKKKLSFIIHDAHMYVIPNTIKPMARAGVYIDKEDQIVGTGKRYITSDEDLFQKLKPTNCTHIDYTSNSYYIGNNELSWNVNATKDIESTGEKYSTLYTYMDSKYKLRSSLSSKMLEYFQHVSHIRNMIKNPTIKNDYQFDQNGSYPSHLHKKLSIPIATIDDDWEDYDDSRIVKSCFYWITVAKRDPILCPTKRGCYSGYILNTLTEHKRKFSIQFMFKTTGRTVRLNETDDDQITEFSKGQECRYIGWLMKTSSSFSTTYDNVSSDEYKALRYKHGDEVKYTPKDKVLEFRTDRQRATTGILANMIIKDQTNISLFKFNAYIMKHNKGAILNSVKTDSLGYIFNKKMKHPKLSNLPGKFKDESHKIKEIGTYSPANYTLNYDPVPQPALHKDITTYKSTDIIKLLQQQVSFALLGGPGFGKSYNIKNVIIPHLTKHKMKYILCGSTIQASKLLDSETVNSHISNLSNNQLITKFNKISYIIVDEASQLTQGVLLKLEYIKNNTSCNIILVGDKNQCPSIDAGDTSFIVGRCVTNMIDHNHVVLKWHKHARYTLELNNVLQSIVENFNDCTKLFPILRKNFKIKTKSSTRLNVAYTHNKCSSTDYYVNSDQTTEYINATKSKDKEGILEDVLRVPDKGVIACFTVHSIQGCTFSYTDKDGNDVTAPFTIHEVNKMVRQPELLYTAISRARSLSDITLIW